MQKVNKTLTFGLEKRIKERKNTYGGSPNANLDQNGSGMKQRFQFRALDQIVWAFARMGVGYLQYFPNRQVRFLKNVIESCAYTCRKLLVTENTPQ